jgi:hypothetical protein
VSKQRKSRATTRRSTEVQNRMTKNNCAMIKRSRDPPFHPVDQNRLLQSPQTTGTTQSPNKGAKRPPPQGQNSRRQSNPRSTQKHIRIAGSETHHDKAARSNMQRATTAATGQWSRWFTARCREPKQLTKAGSRFLPRGRSGPRRRASTPDPNPNDSIKSTAN